jgi:hypothetical protein
MGKSTAMEDVLRRWQSELAREASAWRRSARKMRERHYLLGVPTVLLSAIAGTTAFTSLVQEAAPPGLRIMIGCVTATVTALATVQTFLRYAERSADYRASAARADGLRRRIELALGSGYDGFRLREEAKRIHAELAADAELAASLPVSIDSRTESTEAESREAERSESPSAEMTAGDATTVTT